MYRHLIVESWRHYRFWLGMKPCLHVELNLFSGRFNFAIGVGTGQDDDVSFRFAPLLFSLYIGLSSASLHRLTRWLLAGAWEGRNTELSIHDATIRLELWAPCMSWSSREPWWMRWKLDIVETIFGRTQHTEREISRVETVIPMPEKSYPCLVVMKSEIWKRRRLPWASQKIVRAHIDCKEGVPHPGKGENSWDCGDDATFGLTCPAETVEQGIAKFVESVLRSRRRYGGSVNWKQEVAA